MNLFSFFFFNDTATTEIYTLSLHDALPIYFYRVVNSVVVPRPIAWVCSRSADGVHNLAPHSFYTVACVKPDRKSTRLNSSHANISYAVFCLKKKNNENSTSPIY